MVPEIQATPGMVVHSVTLALGGRSRKQHKFRSSLVYIMSCRLVRSTDYLRTRSAELSHVSCWTGHELPSRCDVQAEEAAREVGTWSESFCMGRTCAYLLQVRHGAYRSLHHGSTNAVCVSGWVERVEEGQLWSKSISEARLIVCVRYVKVLH